VSRAATQLRTTKGGESVAKGKSMQKEKKKPKQKKK